MTCAACDSQPSGLINAFCRECKLRHLAKGPLFFESMTSGALTKDYKAALKALGEVHETHKAVRSIFDALQNNP
jgi:hypothetical protein